MTYLTNIYRVFGKIRRTSQGKLVVIGIWMILFILLFDSFNPNGNMIMNISYNFRNFLIVEKVAPFVSHRPFDPRHPKLVILLAYQRVGSSFTGQIFNQNPGFFYTFEPIDGIYSAMYGTAHGYNVPSDIAYYWNGTKRAIPVAEEDAIAEVLGSILTCDLDNIPTEVLLHRFFYLFHHHHNRIRPYLTCIKKKGLKIADCREHIKHICPRRFGADVDKHLYCKSAIWNGRADVFKTEADKVAFAKYQNCVFNIREKLSDCMPLMQKACDNSSVRATKTVRLNMETAEYMFKHFTNLRVLQLIRDPRAVALSRMSQSTFRAKYSSTVPKEAELYCAEVLEDIKVRKRIEEKFPGSVMQIIYENIVSNPMEQIGAVYSFLNETLPKEVKTWLGKNTEGAKRNSSKIAARWQEKLTFKVAKQVSDACSDLYDAVNYRWPQ